MNDANRELAEKILAHLRDDFFLFALHYRGCHWYVWKFEHEGRTGTIGVAVNENPTHAVVGIFKWGVVLDEDGCRAELDAGAPS
ncbi:MAG TPA: hypothetical protein VLT45_22025 [Kofleriaceae bacterium]|nr:hypothetical protein [Kofleriaceae bacterium]